MKKVISAAVILLAAFVAFPVMPGLRPIGRKTFRLKHLSIRCVTI